MNIRPIFSSGYLISLQVKRSAQYEQAIKVAYLKSHKLLEDEPYGADCKHRLQSTRSGLIVDSYSGRLLLVYRYVTIFNDFELLQQQYSVTRHCELYKLFMQ